MRDKLFLILCTLLLLILFFYSSSSDDTVAAPDMPQTASWFDRLIGNDYDFDEVDGATGGGGGGGFFFSSFYGGVEFRFKVKDYRAWNDDDLSE